MEVEIERLPFIKQLNPCKYNLTCKNDSYTNYKEKESLPGEIPNVDLYSKLCQMHYSYTMSDEAY